MKKVVYALILPLVIAGGIVIAQRDVTNNISTRSIQKPLTNAEMQAARKQWEASPDGIAFKRWEASTAGIKVYSAEAMIRNQLNNEVKMEAVITSLSLPPGSKLGFGLMVQILGEAYIVRFDADKAQLEQLKTLKVDDRILIQSRNVSHAPKYAYPIISGDLVERGGEIIFKRAPRKGGC